MDDGTTALFIAARNGCHAIVRMLIEAGAEVNKKTNEGLTALHSALHMCDSQTVDVLLQNHADVNEKAQGSMPPICFAALANAPGCVQLLIDAGANIDARDSDGETALYTASFRGFVEVVRILLLAGANPNILSKGGANALHVSVQDGHEDVVKLLLAHGANPLLKTRDGRSALHIASSRDSIEITKALGERLRQIKEEREREKEAASVTESSRRDADSRSNIGPSSTPNGSQPPSTTSQPLPVTVPRSFRCPITFCMMTDPVVAADGHSYERDAITKWIKSRGSSPITLRPLSLDKLVPNLNLKVQIDEFKLTNPHINEFPESPDGPFSSSS